MFVVTGSAAQPWPRPGCHCVSCVAGADPLGRAPVGLDIAGALHLDGLGVLAPDGRTEHLAAGQTEERGAVRLLALPGPDGATAALAVGHRGRTVLWAPAGPDGARRLAEDAVSGLSGAALDAAVLDLRGEDGGLDPVGLAHELARLRRVGALAGGAQVIAVGLSHEAPVHLVRRRLDPWRVRLVEPGTALAEGPAAPPVPAPRRTLVLGPASSGKSAHAEDLLAAEPEVDYLATGPAPDGSDGAWAQRVARHRARRPTGWRTVEDADQPIAGVLTSPGPPLLLDSLGGWVSAALDRCGGWRDAPGWADRWAAEVDAVVAAWRGCARRVVAVGEETGWGVIPATASGRLFREELGTLTRRLAAESECSRLVVAGRVVDLDGGTP